MTLSESEIRDFVLPKAIKERSIGGEDTHTCIPTKTRYRQEEKSQTEDLARKMED